MPNLRPRANDKVSLTFLATRQPPSQPHPAVTTKKSCRKQKPNKSSLRPAQSAIQKNKTKPQKKIRIKLNFAKPRALSVSTIWSDVSFVTDVEDDIFLPYVAKNPVILPAPENFLESSALPVILQSTEATEINHLWTPLRKAKHKMALNIRLPRPTQTRDGRSAFTYAIASGFWGDSSQVRVLPSSRHGEDGRQGARDWDEENGLRVKNWLQKTENADINGGE